MLQVQTSVGRALAEDEHRRQVERALMRDANTYLQSVPTKRLYYETSARTGEGVPELFEFIQSTLLEEMERQRGGGGGRRGQGQGMDRSIRVGESQGAATKKKSCCDK